MGRPPVTSPKNGPGQTAIYQFGPSEDEVAAGVIRSSRVHRSLGLMSWCQLENPLEHHWLGPLVHSDVASRPFFSADNSSAASPLRGNVTRMVVVEGPPPLAPLVQFAVLLAG